MAQADQGEKFRADLLRRLDVLISLLLEAPKADARMNMTQKIVRLKELGLSPAEIAHILDRTVNYVTGALSMRKRRAKKSKVQDA
jgi:DNA-binding CsgD family transcriptional regulator